eukprot:Hpha_TRINITY_DN26771_c0_g1::TRINITY_DN26771_c0_g1_i1::g.138783::m.138783
MLKRRGFVGQGADLLFDTGTLCINLLEGAERGDIGQIDACWKVLAGHSGAISPDDIIDKDTAQGPTHVAASNGRVRVLEWILQEGGSASLRDSEGCLPAHHAAAGGHQDVLEWLYDHGEELRARDNNGLTPRQYAILGDQRETVSWLNRFLRDKGEDEDDDPLKRRPTAMVTDLTREAMQLIELRSNAPAGPVNMRLWREVVAVFAFPGLLAGVSKPLPWKKLPDATSVLMTFTEEKVAIAGGMLNV